MRAPKCYSLAAGGIVGITIAILVLLFSVQSLGTSKIGVLFSPILIIWFVMNAALGLYDIIKCVHLVLSHFCLLQTSSSRQTVAAMLS